MSTSDNMQELTDKSRLQANRDATTTAYLMSSGMSLVGVAYMFLNGQLLYHFNVIVSASGSSDTLMALLQMLALPITMFLGSMLLLAGMRDIIEAYTKVR